MNSKTTNILLTIAAIALMVGGLILLLVSIFGETGDNRALCFALTAIILANLFNILRIQRLRKDKAPEDRDRQE